MRNIVMTVAMMVVLVPLNALSQEPVKDFQFHSKGGLEKPVDPSIGETGLAKVIKNVKLPNYQSKTFGEAVDSYRYFSKNVWKETASSNGKVYVDFTGWLKKSIFDFNKISERGVGIKFLVNPNGSYGVVMVSKVEIRTDGKIYSDPLTDIQGILNKLYNNVEIKF